LNIYAAKGFPIDPKRFGMDKFVGIGTILYYYEVTQMSSRHWLVPSKVFNREMLLIKSVAVCRYGINNATFSFGPITHCD
jgi:hypothetical protein